MNAYKGFKVGDRVTVKMNDKAYDDGPTITPGMVGTIKAFPPKVMIVKGPVFDGLPYFAYAEFDAIIDHVHGNHVRGGIDICNLALKGDSNA